MLGKPECTLYRRETPIPDGVFRVSRWGWQLVIDHGDITAPWPPVTNSDDLDELPRCLMKRNLYEAINRDAEGWRLHLGFGIADARSKGLWQ